MALAAHQFDDELTTIITADYGVDVPLPAMTKTVVYWGIAAQPIIDIEEGDGTFRRTIEFGRKVAGKREARAIAKSINASFYC
jgi:hypothetical protein